MPKHELYPWPSQLSSEWPHIKSDEVPGHTKVGCITIPLSHPTWNNPSQDSGPTWVEVGLWPSLVPRLTWMSVGRTNPLRAAFFSSGASGAKNVAFTPPYNIHNWIPLHVTWPRASPKLLKFNSSRSYGRFRCASSLSTRAPPVCPLITDDFFLKLYFSVSDLGFVPLWILWCLFNIW